MLHVCLCDWDKVCPQESVLFFYWLLQGEKGRRPWRISFKTLRLSQESGGNNGDTQTSWKVVQTLHLLSPACVYTIDGCLQGMWTLLWWPRKHKKRRRGRRKKGFRKCTQEVMAGFWTKFRGVKFKFHSGVTDIIACIKTTRGCLISCQHITSTTQGCTSDAACRYAQMTFLCLSVRFLQRTSLVWIPH